MGGIKISGSRNATCTHHYLWHAMQVMTGRPLRLIQIPAGEKSARIVRIIEGIGRLLSQ